MFSKILDIISFKGLERKIWSVGLTPYTLLNKNELKVRVYKANLK